MTVNPQRAPLPVTIISGFLGSGKTTLLRRILSADARGGRIAVIENELGNVTIDDDFLADSPAARLETVIGRTCCETREAFVSLLRGIADCTEKYDRLVIEATGVAHPGMMAKPIFADPELRDRLRLDGIITVIDAANFSAHLDGDGHAREQLACADCVLVNKSDLSTPEKIAKLVELLKAINPAAKYSVVKHAEADIGTLLNVGGFDADKISAAVEDCAHASCGSLHKHEISTVALKSDDTYAFLSLKEWLEEYISKHSDDIFRAKGVVSLANVDRKMVLQGVHDNFYVDLGEPWDVGVRTSRLIFIGRNLNASEIEAGLAKCRVR